MIVHYVVSPVERGEHGTCSDPDGCSEQAAFSITREAGPDCLLTVFRCDAHRPASPSDLDPEFETRVALSRKIIAELNARVKFEVPT